MKLNEPKAQVQKDVPGAARLPSMQSGEIIEWSAPLVPREVVKFWAPRATLGGLIFAAIWIVPVIITIRHRNDINLNDIAQIIIGAMGIGAAVWPIFLGMKAKHEVAIITNMRVITFNKASGRSRFIAKDQIESVEYASTAKLESHGLRFFIGRGMAPEGGIIRLQYRMIGISDVKGAIAALKKIGKNVI